MRRVAAPEMASLRGKTIAITEARRATELANLVTKLGGVPRSAPAMREVPRRDREPARAVLERICRGEVETVVFLTGVGARAFLDLAAETGQRERLVQALGRLSVVARGPKPVAALRAAGIRVDLTPAEPTSEGLLEALARKSTLVSGKVVAVQSYGEDNPLLTQGLTALGATVLEIPLYEWTLPEDPEPLERLVRELVGGTIDVLAVTSSPQVRHLFAVAERLGLADRLEHALRESVVVGVVGPVCEAALVARGIVPRVRAGKPTMGALVHAIADFLSAAEAVPGEALIAPEEPRDPA